MTVCKICPHMCDLDTGSIGKCLVRKNIDGSIKPIFYGRCSVVTVDRIEKKPFFHFYPGSSFLSIGLVGCNLSCSFCQNFKISQSVDVSTTFLSANDLVSLAVDKSVTGICFSHNEPTIHYEYIMDVGDEIRSRNLDLKLIVKTNGFINSHVIDDLDLVVDAWNVDLKGTDYEYQNICGGYISPVCAVVERIFSKRSHLEISYLVTKNIVDNLEHHTVIRDWLCNMDANIPVHILFCYPIHKMNDSYDRNKLKNIYNIFKCKLNNVYISNVFSSDFIKYRGPV